MRVTSTDPRAVRTTEMMRLLGYAAITVAFASIAAAGPVQISVTGQYTSNYDAVTLVQLGDRVTGIAAGRDAQPIIARLVLSVDEAIVGLGHAPAAAQHILAPARQGADH